MEAEIGTHLSRHLLRFAQETLATIQDDPELNILCEQGLNRHTVC